VGTLSLWDSASGELIQQLGDLHGLPPNVAFRRDSQTILSAGLDGSIIEWRVADLSEITCAPGCTAIAMSVISHVGNARNITLSRYANDYCGRVADTPTYAEKSLLLSSPMHNLMHPLI
jgi:WD40 repeat protein